LIKKYSIEDLGISNTLYIINHIEEYLSSHHFHILSKNQENLRFRYKLWWWKNPAFSEGNVRVHVVDKTLFIQFKYGMMDIWIIGFTMLAMSLIFPFTVPEFPQRWMILIILLILILFHTGFRLLQRYFDAKKHMYHIDTVMSRLNNG
jgi:hypothetical protein